RSAITFKSDFATLASFDANRFINSLITFELWTGRALRPDEALLASQHQHGPVHQVEVVLGGIRVIAI
ncbi:hypothetical protein ALC57_10538, partial [Trachymyrmex cornetzi]